MTIIYGVDTSKPVTPNMVRDAIIECFTQSHSISTGFDQKKQNTKTIKEYCRQMIISAFNKENENYERPTKESLIKVIENLANFSLPFRDIKVIEKNKKSIMSLINLL